MSGTDGCMRSARSEQAWQDFSPRLRRGFEMTAWLRRGFEMKEGEKRSATVRWKSGYCVALHPSRRGGTAYKQRRLIPSDSHALPAAFFQARLHIERFLTSNELNCPEVVDVGFRPFLRCRKDIFFA